MALWICEECGAEFRRNRSGVRPIRFCSQDCYHAWNRREGNGGGRFQEGIVPWNKGTKGVMKANTGSFKPGRDNGRQLPVGAIRVRTDKTGRRRAWVKLRDTRHPSDWELWAVVVWRKANGELPTDHLVHHRDGNALNDRLDNLQAVSRAEHLAIHRPAFEERRSHAAGKAAKARHARNRAARKQGATAPATIL